MQTTEISSMVKRLVNKIKDFETANAVEEVKRRDRL